MKQLNMFGASPTPKGFEDWWGEYPNKVAKLDAQRAFLAAVKAGYAASDLVAGARAYAAQCRKDKVEKKYIAHPGTFLRAGRWMDEGLQSDPSITPEAIEAARDKADRLMKRGKYAPVYE